MFLYETFLKLSRIRTGIKPYIDKRKIKCRCLSQSQSVMISERRGKKPPQNIHRSLSKDSAFVSGSCGAADKGQPSIIVSHLWAAVPGSVTLLISSMLACLQWTGAHQLPSVLARHLCGPTAARHTKESPARHNNTEINTNTPPSLNKNKTEKITHHTQIKPGRFLKRLQHQHYEYE